MLLCATSKPDIDWAPWVQAAIYFATLVVLTYQIWLMRKQNKLQVKNTRNTDYIRCQIDFSETFRELLINQQNASAISHSYHSKIYDSLNNAGSKFSKWKTYEPEQKLMYGFFEIIYELFERVYCIKENDNEHDPEFRIVDAKEWEYWESWIDDVKKHPIFKDIYEDNKGMFDEGFEKLIRSKLEAIYPELANSQTN